MFSPECTARLGVVNYNPIVQSRLAITGWKGNGLTSPSNTLVVTSEYSVSHCIIMTHLTHGFIRVKPTKNQKKVFGNSL